MEPEADFLVRVVVASVSKVFRTSRTLEGPLSSMNSLMGLNMNVKDEII